jgi:hypothetical protein
MWQSSSQIPTRYSFWSAARILCTNWRWHNACSIQQFESVGMSNNRFWCDQQGLEWFDVVPHQWTVEVWQECQVLWSWWAYLVLVIVSGCLTSPEPSMPFKHTCVAYVSSLHACLMITRGSFTLFLRFAQTLMHICCSFVRFITKLRQARYTTLNRKDIKKSAYPSSCIQFCTLTFKICYCIVLLQLLSWWQHQFRKLWIPPCSAEFAAHPINYQLKKTSIYLIWVVICGLFYANITDSI